MAKRIFEHLQLKDKIQSVRYIENLDEFEKLPAEKDTMCFFIVDINLGKGRREEGLKVIETVRKNEPDALILVYSAYPDKEHKSLEVGADLFFEKNAHTYEDDIFQIRNSIVRALNEKEKIVKAHKEREKIVKAFKKREESWANITIMYSQIIDIDKEYDLVRLKYKLEKDSSETLERKFPLSVFKNIDKLTAGQSILVKNLERPGEVRFIFKKAEEDYFEK